MSGFTSLQLYVTSYSILFLKAFKEVLGSISRFEFLWVCGFSNEWGRKPDPFVEKLWLPFCYLLVAISKERDIPTFPFKTFDLSPAAKAEAVARVFIITQNSKNDSPKRNYPAAFVLPFQRAAGLDKDDYLLRGKNSRE